MKCSYIILHPFRFTFLYVCLDRQFDQCNMSCIRKHIYNLIIQHLKFEILYIFVIFNSCYVDQFDYIGTYAIPINWEGQYKNFISQIFLYRYNFFQTKNYLIFVIDRTERVYIRSKIQSVCNVVSCYPVLMFVSDMNVGNEGAPSSMSKLFCCQEDPIELLVSYKTEYSLFTLCYVNPLCSQEGPIFLFCVDQNTQNCEFKFCTLVYLDTIYI